MRTLKSSLLSPAKKQGMAAYNAAGNQQKNLYASGQIPQSMKMAAAYGGGWSPAYDSVLKTAKDSWAKWTPATEKDYQARIDQKTSWPNMALAGTQPSKPSKAPPKTGTTNPPKSNQPGSGYSGQSTIRPPKYIDDGTTEDAAQNALALGIQNSDNRYQTKSLSRPGFSQGKGQEFLGARQATQEMNKAAGQAADIRAQDQLANSRMRSDYQKGSEMEAQQQAMLQHAIGQSGWARNFAETSADAQTQMAYIQAMLGIQSALLR